MTHGFLKAIDFVKKDLSNFAVGNINLDYRALCKNVHDLDISSLLHCLHDSLHKKRMDLSNIGVGNPKLDRNFLFIPSLWSITPKLPVILCMSNVMSFLLFTLLY